MKVRVNVEREVVLDRASGDYVDVEFGYIIPSIWANEIGVTEPVHPGVYRLTPVNDSPSFFALKLNDFQGSPWQLFGRWAKYTWLEFGAIQEVTYLARS